MHKKNQNRQYQFTDFNQPVGLKMDPENRWGKKAAMIPWDAIEEKYAELFPSDTGNPAKPVRVALGALLIQKQYGYADRELVEQIRENPYYQYFIGLPGYQQEQPFTPSLLVAFRKRLTDDLLDEINEMIIEYNQPDDPDPGDGNPPDGGGRDGILRRLPERSGRPPQGRRGSRGGPGRRRGVPSDLLGRRLPRRHQLRLHGIFAERRRADLHPRRTRPHTCADSAP